MCASQQCELCKKQKNKRKKKKYTSSSNIFAPFVLCQKYACRDKTFFATKLCLSRQNYVCRDKTNIILSRKKVLSRQTHFCRDKQTQNILSRQTWFCCGKHTFVATKDVFCVVATKLLILVAVPANDSFPPNKQTILPLEILPAELCIHGDVNSGARDCRDSIKGVQWTPVAN